MDASDMGRQLQFSRRGMTVMATPQPTQRERNFLSMFCFRTAIPDPRGSIENDWPLPGLTDTIPAPRNLPLKNVHSSPNQQ